MLTEHKSARFPVRPLHVLLLAVLLLSVLVAASTTATDASAAGSPSREARCKHVDAPTRVLKHSTARDAMRCLFNRKRGRLGLRKLHGNDALSHAAQKHSRVMRRHRCFAHQCGGEADLLTRISEAGYLRGASKYAYSENIAYTGHKNSTPRHIFKDWMHSSGHRANILGSAHHVGLGMIAKHGSSYWTADFGSRG